MKPTIIFVDDNSNVREGIKRILRHKPYRVLTLESAQQCVEILAVTDVQVLVTDLEMPGFNGHTLISYFKEYKPEVVRIVLSGKLNLQTTLDLINKGEVFRCLEKPCSAPTLLAVIKDGLMIWETNQTTPKGAMIAHAAIESNLSQNNSTSLIRDALKDVEQLGQALKEHSGQGRPIFTK